MTKTKRKRLYVESGNPVPGDTIVLPQGLSIRRRPGELQTLAVVRYSDIAQRDKPRPKIAALVLGMNEWLDWLLILTPKGTLGWVSLLEMKDAQRRAQFDS